MKAMLLRRLASLAENPTPLAYAEVPDPEPAPGEVLIRVSACAVCHTELDEIERRTPPPHLPVILGHQVVGTIAAVGEQARGVTVGERVGVAWIYGADGTCAHCRAGNENLCPNFMATGRDANGGYAEWMTARADFVHPVPNGLGNAEAAPLLCAGAVGYRSLKLTGLNDGEVLGLTGFGASGHLVLKAAQHLYPHSPVFVFARSPEEQTFARELGAAWAGGTEDMPPQLLDAIIDTTPAWRPVVAALGRLAPGGRLVINAIRKEDSDKSVLAGMDYTAHLWHEKQIKSVANVTGADVREFLTLAAKIPLTPEYQPYPLADANAALRELKQRKIRGAKVLMIE